MDADFNPLATWIRRFLIVAGYAIGISGSVQALLIPFIRPPYFDFLSLYGPLKPFYLLFLIASSLAQVVLLIGIWRFHRRRKWARGLLLIYIAACIAGALGLHLVTSMATIRQSPRHAPALLGFGLGLGLIQVVELIDPCVYPLLLLLCLLRPEFRDNFAGRGFSPVVNPPSSTADQRPVPVDSIQLEGRA